ncbi:hypothetical protein [Deinococcus cellulosilyticus]|uniref:Uncharacterized protein n=1 Tax=Deinococcus cellulosilyticus (strain DSM 18568 / NBRC 106333 / KACC 11606 / 5516J-15) TaxID=1223518 RepID=A0A511N8J7_DEIC1|nr:hypothetical protein [Deinococcus cellulosilyticus]GEM48808.1 hypothetical protein DC3_44430 [Deinococcus cellulosilyticus NBRC 106333 = KACC 11606]
MKETYPKKGNKFDPEQYQPDVPPMTLQPFTPGPAGEVRAVATAADLLTVAAQCEAIQFDWIGLTGAYLDWKKRSEIGDFRWHARTSAGPVRGVDKAPDMVHFKGQEFRPDLVPVAVTIFPHAIRDGSLSKFTDLLVTRGVRSVECIAPDPLSTKRVLRLHTPTKIFTLTEDKKEGSDGAGTESPAV